MCGAHPARLRVPLCPVSCVRCVAHVHLTFRNVQRSLLNVHRTFRNVKQSLPHVHRSFLSVHQTFLDVQRSPRSLHTPFRNVHGRLLNVRGSLLSVHRVLPNALSAFLKVQWSPPHPRRTVRSARGVREQETGPAGIGAGPRATEKSGGKRTPRPPRPSPLAPDAASAQGHCQMTVSALPSGFTKRNCVGTFIGTTVCRESPPLRISL